jgi:hypothetical protein
VSKKLSDATNLVNVGSTIVADTVTKAADGRFKLHHMSLRELLANLKALVSSDVEGNVDAAITLASELQDATGEVADDLKATTSACLLAARACLGCWTCARVARWSVLAIRSTELLTLASSRSSLPPSPRLRTKRPTPRQPGLLHKLVVAKLTGAAKVATTVEGVAKAHVDRLLASKVDAVNGVLGERAVQGGAGRHRRVRMA